MSDTLAQVRLRGYPFELLELRLSSVASKGEPCASFFSRKTLASRVGIAHQTNNQSSCWWAMPTLHTQVEQWVPPGACSLEADAVSKFRRNCQAASRSSASSASHNPHPCRSAHNSPTAARIWPTRISGMASDKSFSAACKSALVLLSFINDLSHRVPPGSSRQHTPRPSEEQGENCKPQSRDQPGKMPSPAIWPSRM